MNLNWRKYNRVLHRDFGYFFTGMVIIYALSGIALNHRKDWNPNYIINRFESEFTPNKSLQSNDKEAIIEYLSIWKEDNNYKSHYQPAPGVTKIFLQEGGSVQLDFNTNLVLVETIKKRPIFNQVNFLHYNPGNWWKWFSDIFCGALIVIAITGLFILKGKNSVTGRGAWLTALGIVIPLILFLVYY